MDYKPLTITAHISTPVAGDKHLPIDGVLLSLACEKAYGFLSSQKPLEIPDFDPSVSPVRILRWGDNWMYQSSFAIWGKTTKSQNFFTRRHNETESELLSFSKQWDTGRGEYRNIYHKYEQAHTPYITWDVVGDADAIIALLSECDAIGKYRQKGAGVVSQWDVTFTNGDMATHGILNQENQPLKAVPLSYVSHSRLPIALKTKIGRIAYRPPYWINTNYGDCYLP
jgi:hypothetical protein